MAAATLAVAQPKAEVGEINLRIDVPENWNHNLVIYCHGYTTEPVNETQKELPKVVAVFVKEGYALAQSGYSARGLGD